jgi:LuxR family transcriptional regulator, maltose regulon positive regulatory protein
VVVSATITVDYRWSLVEISFDLPEAKLASPSVRPGTVAKTDAIARLSAASAPFATVVAPAGYGKTTLLAQWADADPRPFAWVALDRSDDDSLMLLRSIATAMDRIEPVSPDVFDALSGPGESIWSARVPRVGGALSARKRPLVLAFDDLHAVDNQTSLDVLGELSRYVPAGSQIAFASREEPTLPLARWRADGSLGEIGLADLRLDEHEAALLLAAAGLELDAGEVAELTERTEGWPAGLYLAALSINAGATSISPEDFTGGDRFVSEYFRLELLSRLPEAEAQFLKHTAVLERMCGDLCDFVLETGGSAQTLETLTRRNGFVVPLDRHGEWYRYHHLFRELLKNELERTEPNAVPALNARAMTWCMDNDLPEEAIVYGYEAGETTSIATLIDAHLLPLYYDGRLDTVKSWLGWFGDDQLEQYPGLAVYGAWIRALTGRPEDAQRWLALAEGADSTIPLSDGSTTIEPWVATLRTHMMPTGVERALADANAALDQLSEGSFWIPTALLGRGVAHALLGASDRATDDLMAVIKRATAVGAAEEVYLAEAQLALLAAKQGAWGEAERRARAAQAAVDQHGLGTYSSSALAHVATTRVAIHQGRQEDARAEMSQAHRLRPLLDHGIPWVTIQVGLELARAHLALGEPGAARTVFREVEDVLELRPQMGALVDESLELRDRLTAASGSDGAWAMSLTGAELRLLPYLATHLTVPEIATRLFISRNTVKTEAVSIYRKLNASSRSEAIERAVQVGLLESPFYAPLANLTQQG